MPRRQQRVQDRTTGGEWTRAKRRLFRLSPILRDVRHAPLRRHRPLGGHRRHALRALRRLAALSLVLALLLVLLLLLPLYSAWGLVTFFLVWLGEFKLLLLAFGHGPLHPRTRPLPFVFAAALPVKLRQQPHATAKTAAGGLPLLSSAAFTAGIKFGIAGVIGRYFHTSKDRVHPYAAFALYCVVMYCVLDSVLPWLAKAGRALGMELEPQFDKPYLSASLQDFRGRRWNLVVSAVLRPAVYGPVRARLGAAAAVLATFLVSGLMHKVVVYYLTFRKPTGWVTAFALHGACVCAERWCTRRWRWPPLPRAVATPLVVAFVRGTACWLFLPEIFGDGLDDLYLAEVAALASSFVDVAGRIL